MNIQLQRYELNRDDLDQILALLNNLKQQNKPDELQEIITFITSRPRRNPPTHLDDFHIEQMKKEGHNFWDYLEFIVNLIINICFCDHRMAHNEIAFRCLETHKTKYFTNDDIHYILEKYQLYHCYSNLIRWYHSHKQYNETLYNSHTALNNTDLANSHYLLCRKYQKLIKSTEQSLLNLKHELLFRIDNAYDYKPIIQDYNAIISMTSY